MRGVLGRHGSYPLPWVGCLEAGPGLSLLGLSVSWSGTGGGVLSAHRRVGELRAELGERGARLGGLGSGLG